MSKLKKIIGYILTFVLTLGILLFVFINILTSTIFNKQFILKELDETSYYIRLQGYIKNNLENYIPQSGFDESILDNVVTIEQIKDDTEKVITNLYNNINEEITAKEIKQRLAENIKEQIKDQNITEEQKQNLYNFIEDISKQYLNDIAHFEFENIISNIIHKAMDLCGMANKIAILLIGIILISLIVICKRRIYRLFVFIGIALSACGGIYYLIKLYICSKINLNTITILNEAFSTVLKSTIQAIVNNFEFVGLCMFVIGISLIVSSIVLHNKIKYSKINYKA